MTAAHTARGKATERMAATWFRGNGFDGCERTRRMGYAVGARIVDDEGDLTLAPGVIAQVKSLRPVNRAERAVPGWLAETEAQRQAADADVGLLVVRRDGTGDVGEWFAFWRFQDFAKVVEGGDWRFNPADWDEIPVRLLVADAARLLRAAGYGTPLTEEATG